VILWAVAVVAVALGVVLAVVLVAYIRAGLRDLERMFDL